MTLNYIDNKDLYPSRKGKPPKIYDRIDPVVYSNDSESPISSQLIKKYKKNGYLKIDNFFSPEEITSYQKELEYLLKADYVVDKEKIIREPNSHEIRSIFQIHQISKVYKKLSKHKDLLSLVKFLLNDNIYIFQSRLNFKPGFRGKEFYWHSDFETWHVEDGMPSMRAVSISIPLTTNTYENGPLMFIPGSHKKFISCQGFTPINHFRRSLKQQNFGVPDDLHLSELINQNGIESMICEPGCLILFDCNTIHGSNSNISSFSRSNIFIVYNSIKNKVSQPYSGQSPRPEYICTRKKIEPII